MLKQLLVTMILTSFLFSPVAQAAPLSKQIKVLQKQVKVLQRQVKLQNRAIARLTRPRAITLAQLKGSYHLYSFGVGPSVGVGFADLFIGGTRATITFDGKGGVVFKGVVQPLVLTITGVPAFGSNLTGAPNTPRNMVGTYSVSGKNNVTLNLPSSPVPIQGAATISREVITFGDNNEPGYNGLTILIRQ